MRLSELLKDRELWQNNTVNRMRDALLYKPTSVNRMSSGEKLVVVYGPPQIGKTTLILNLLGIAKEYQDEVYGVLRAGVNKGNSSTSTAIIYQKSPSDLFGVRYESTDTPIIDEVKYYDTQGIIQFLKNVRETVECGKASKEILYIFLPKKFFIQESSIDENMDILDLPGDGSRNENEADHVQDILRKYLAMASVCIIVCKGNEIQSLETLEIQGVPDWRLQPNRCFGVITNAYGQGSIKKYFLQNRVNRKIDFASYVEDQYEIALQTILPQFCQVKFFPVDMGDSLKKLLDSLRQEDRIIVEETLENIFLRMRMEIMSHKGNTLKSTIDLLRVYSSEYVGEQINELKEEIADIEMQRNNISLQIGENRIRITECENMILSLAGEYEKIIGMEKSELDCSIQSYKKDTIQYVEENFGKRISDPKKTILEKFKDNLMIYLKNLQNQVNYSELLISDADTMYSDLVQNIPFEEEMGSLLYPKAVIHFLRKADRDRCIELISGNFKVVENTVSEWYAEQKKTVLKQYKLSKEKYLNYRQLKIECNRDIQSCLRKKNELEDELIIRRNRLSTLLENKENDQKVLSEYLEVAKDEFSKQMNQCKNFLAGCTRDELAAAVIFMALLERDYNDLIRRG